MNISLQAVEAESSNVPIQPSERLELRRNPASPTPLQSTSQFSPAINNNHNTDTTTAHTQWKAYYIAMYKLHETWAGDPYQSIKEMDMETWH